MTEKNIIQKNPFNLQNIQIQQRSLQEIQKIAQQELAELSVNPFLDYLSENDRVFSGEVAGEIRQYQSQMYTLGQVMREGQAHSSLNIKM